MCRSARVLTRMAAQLTRTAHLVFAGNDAVSERRRRAAVAGAEWPAPDDTSLFAQLTGMPSAWSHLLTVLLGPRGGVLLQLRSSPRALVRLAAHALSLSLPVLLGLQSLPAVPLRTCLSHWARVSLSLLSGHVSVDTCHWARVSLSLLTGHVSVCVGGVAAAAGGGGAAGAAAAGARAGTWRPSAAQQSAASLRLRADPLAAPPLQRRFRADTPSGAVTAAPRSAPAISEDVDMVGDKHTRRRLWESRRKGERRRRARQGALFFGMPQTRLVPTFSSPTLAPLAEQQQQQQHEHSELDTALSDQEEIAADSDDTDYFDQSDDSDDDYDDLGESEPAFSRLQPRMRRSLSSIAETCQ
ncbi:MAG: hypothetical protein MHM6MM_008354 [Cercozoa sp. M6MM]